MKTRHWLAPVLLLALGSVPLMAQIFVPGSVSPPPVMPVNPGTLTARIAAKANLTEKQVDAVLRELGPAVAERLASGQGFELQGVGAFRVIRIAAHRELAPGLQAIEVPARNTVQFVPTGDVEFRLNRPDAVPGVSVGEPDTSAGLNRVGPTRTPGVREGRP